MKKTDNPSKPQKVWYENFSFETDGIMIVLSDKKLIQKRLTEPNTVQCMASTKTERKTNLLQNKDYASVVLYAYDCITDCVSHKRTHSLC